MKNENRLSADTDSLSDPERKQLRARILFSVEQRKNRRKVLRYTMATAASIALLLGSGWFLTQKESPSITDFIKTSNKNQINKSEGVTLMLGKGNNVTIDQDDPTISYSASGQKVNVGHSRTVDQQINDDEKVAYNTLIVPYGKRSELKLSDGSKVWINSGSRLIYPAVFQGQKREVYLEGEAIFEVAHNKDKPFIVLSENQEIEVLGTIFNVNNYSDEDAAFTVLKNGSVSIRHKENSSNSYKNTFNISPGTFAGFHKGTNKIITKKVNVEQYFSWREGVFIFRNDDLSTIMRRLSRYYNVDFEINSTDLANDTFSGYLDLKDDIEKVLQIIKETTDMDYTITENPTILITIKPKGV